MRRHLASSENIMRTAAIYSGSKLRFTHMAWFTGAAIARRGADCSHAKRIICVGTCGGFRQDLQPGSICDCHGHSKNTGYGRTAKFWLSSGCRYGFDAGFRSNGRSASIKTASGIVLTRGQFYAGVPTRNIPDYSAAAANVLAVETRAHSLSGHCARCNAAVLAVDGRTANRRKYGKLSATP